MISRSIGVLCAALILGACRNPAIVEASTPSVHPGELVYEITDLGSLGGAFARAEQINELGHVAGLSTNAAGENRAFFWDGSVMHDLGPVACCVMLLNDQDQVAWTSVVDGSLRAMFWDNGTLHNLGTLGGSFSRATGINNIGQVVGTSGVDSSSSFQGHGFVWHNGVMTDLGTLGGPYSGAAGINDQGQIVGTSRLDFNSSLEHAFSWQDGRLTDLGSLGGRSEAVAINPQGWIIGVSSPGSDWAPFYPVLWRDGQIVTIGTRPGDFYASVTAANGRGGIAGLSCPNLSCDERYPFAWKAGKLTTLDPEYPFPFWQLVSAINDDGLVVGYREVANPRGSRAVVWDENSGAGQDLGGLDGAWAGALDIDETGTVVGWASTASGQNHAVIWRRVGSTPARAVAATP